jgi:putative hemolysin
MENSVFGIQFYIVVLIILLALSAFFSASETALTSSSKIKLKKLLRDGDQRAATVLYLINNYDDALTAILIGNNVVNIASASIATVVFIQLFGHAELALSTIVMTVLVLVFGEITPKSLAKENPESFALATGSFLKFVVRILTPLCYLFMHLKNLLATLLHAKKASRHVITEAELKVIVDEVANQGTINYDESALIKSAIEFDDIRVKEILTPRVDMVYCNILDSNAAILRTFSSHGFSRLPVYDVNEENIIGMIHAKDFYDAYLKDRHFKLPSILKDIVYVHRMTKISLVLKNMQKAKVQIAVVIDSYGSVAGVVTIEDIIEELVGEIWDEHDEAVAAFHKIGPNRYLINCDSLSRNASLKEMFEYMHLDFERYDLENQSISGWVVDTLGEIPEKGDTYSYRNLDITVNKTNKNRVLEIVVNVRREE